ncbi:MAG: DUF2207 domain-containing protein, partial [Ginsengibacter sp.]
MKKVFLFVFLASVFQFSKAQEAFLIRHYSIDVKINKNASLDFTETLDVHFAEPRHGIIRSIQYQYPLQSLPAGVEKAERQMEANGYAHIIIENIKVPHWKFSINKSGDYENIRIGSSEKYVEGDQQYVIKYQVLNAINFFQNHSEFYYNLIGNQWATTIDSAEFKVELPQALRDT